MAEALLGEEAAVAALLSGAVIALPTDTVYGLAALAERHDACEQIFVLKERPPGLALPLLIGALEQGLGLCDAPPPSFFKLAGLWPGPLTIVTRRAPGRALALGGEEDAVGLRCPAHELVRSLALRVGPLAVTSANRHGAPPATTARQCELVFGDELALILDGGTCDRAPSTVVSLLSEKPVVLREGPISSALIGETLRS